MEPKIKDCVTKTELSEIMYEIAEAIECHSPESLRHSANLLAPNFCSECGSTLPLSKNIICKLDTCIHKGYSNGS